MTDILTAATRLASTLAAENAALLAMDLPAAAALLAEKQAASAAFDAARTGPMPARSAALREAVERLLGQAAENRRLLERAIAVQTRVIGVVVGAARSCQPAPRYGRSGGYAARPSNGWALSARA